MLVFLSSGSHWKTRLTGNARSRRTSGESGKYAHAHTQASCLLISSSIVCGSERFHCINNYSIVICLAVLSHFRLHRHTLFTSVLKAFSILNTKILWFYSASYCHIFVSQTQGHPGKEGPSGEKGNMVRLSFIFINTNSLA